MVPHDGRWRRSRESHGRLGLAHSGRVVGSRESDGFPKVSDWLWLRLQTWVALVTANGQACERASDEKRRKAERGGVGTPHSLGASVIALGVSMNELSSIAWRSRALRLVGSVIRRLGAPSAPAQWQTPGKWGCVGTRYRTTKPSRGWLWVVVRKPRLILAVTLATANKVTTKPRSYCRGCPYHRSIWCGNVCGK